MTRENFFVLFKAGLHQYDKLYFVEPELALICIQWKRIHLPLDALSFDQCTPSSSYSDMDENGDVAIHNFPIRLKSFSVEFPFNLKSFKRHYSLLFGEHLLAHEIAKGLNAYYGDKAVLEALFDQDYIELSFLVENAKNNRNNIYMS